MSDVTVDFSMNRWFTLTADDAISLAKDLIEAARDAKCQERCTLPD